jgi:hypothetical protein
VYRKWMMAVTFAPLVFVGLGCTAFAQAGRDDAAVIKDFEARVTNYLELRKKQAGSAPRPTNSPDKLANTQQETAAKLQAKRPAAQGDIFTPKISAYLRRQIAATLGGPEGPKIRASMDHAEPVRGLTLKVNQTYPEGVPLQSTPPTVLLNLPPLPKDLEYRFMGRTLVLHDTVPNLIVDFLPDAIPADKD